MGIKLKIAYRKGHCLDCASELPESNYYRWYCDSCRMGFKESRVRRDDQRKQAERLSEGRHNRGTH